MLLKMINKDIKIIVLTGISVSLLFSFVCLLFDKYCALLCFVAGIVIMSVCLYLTKKRYDKLNELNNYLSLVCSGNYDLNIASNTEGELSILQNNLYKVITLLKTQNELLSKDKVYLADSLADISHQLKTPLTSMMVMTDLMKSEKDEQKNKEFLEVIENQLDKMRWLILNLLKVSKIDTGTADFKAEQVSAVDVINESLKPFLVTIDLKQITLINNAENFIFTGDKNWTVEAVGNIIKNCIEHTDKNGIIEINTKYTSIYNSIFIKDNGCGIAKEDLPHIFERFYHGKNSSGESVGIGLALAKMVAEREKAKIIVSSKENEGTQFEFRFYQAII